MLGDFVSVVDDLIRFECHETYVNDFYRWFEVNGRVVLGGQMQVTIYPLNIICELRSAGPTASGCSTLIPSPLLFDPSRPLLLRSRPLLHLSQLLFHQS